LTVLVRLGLRAGEVGALRLCDVDWRGGEIEIRGKGARSDRLPLPVDVGQAVANWLSHGRPDCAHANVFTGLRAPRRALSNGAVSFVVRSAGQRAGLTGVHAHQLRHSAATEMLRAGSNLSEVGLILRHHKLSTTALYAKVDRRTLLAVAQAWPSAS
jgi:integrase